MELDLNKAGAFASNDDLHAREVILGGETHTVFVRQLPAISLSRFSEESRSEDLETRLNAAFQIVSKAIRKEDGSPHMTFENAKRLKSGPMREFLRVLLDVNKQADSEALGND
jgi:hypothetical protein